MQGLVPTTLGNNSEGVEGKEEHWDLSKEESQCCYNAVAVVFPLAELKWCLATFTGRKPPEKENILNI